MIHVARMSIAVLALLIAHAALAQPYPALPIRIVHGFAAGGPPDVVARQIAARLEKRMGAPVIVENRPGASGTIAASSVARAVPDGYTLLFGVAANLVVAPAMMKNPPYDARTAFAPIIEVARGPYVWLVRAEAPARTMDEFVAWARSRPGKLNYASPGMGSVHHLATEMLKRELAIDLVHVPYKAGLYAALLSGEVDAMFESMPGPLPHLAAGRIRALAVTGPRRLPALADVPTLREQRLPDPDVNSWWGFVGPAGLPVPIAARLNAEITAVLSEPELTATLSQWGIAASPGTPEAFAAYIAQETAKWKEIVARTGVPLE